MALNGVILANDSHSLRAQVDLVLAGLKGTEKCKL